MQNANVILQTTPSFLLRWYRNFSGVRNQGQDFKLYIFDVCHKKYKYLHFNR